MHRFLGRIRYIHIRDILHIFLFLLALPASRVLRLFHKDLWIFCEDLNEARDNAYWLFKYVREKHPEIDSVYAINPKCPDAAKVNVLGKTIPYGGFTHWVYYLASSKKISSQKGGKPNPSVCYFLEISGLMKNTRVFLQHGVIKDDAKWLYYDVCRFSLFVCAAKRELEFVENNFGYKGKNIVKLLGLCRFDNLINAPSVLKPKQILVMPTWRDWLARKVASSKKYDDMTDFTKTEYFTVWNSFLHNSSLHELLLKYGYTLVFFPHRQMQSFISSFETSCPNIVIPDYEKTDTQLLLMESAFLITDYSSIFMDFAYMEKPQIYYQFDYEKFRKRHYQEGYFSYEKDGFGEICHTESELIAMLSAYFESNLSLKEMYRERINSFFTIRDNKNCERNFQAIYEL